MNLYFPQIVQAIERKMNEYDYNVMLFNTLNSREIQNHHIRMISTMSLAGLIIVTPNENSKDFLKLDIPIITIDGAINGKVPYVTSDFYNGAKEAVKKLHNNGCKRLLHISGPLIYPSSNERYEGFVDQCNELSIDYDIVQTELDGNDQKRVYQFLDKHEVDGIFAANDSLAFMTIKVMGSLGISIPENIKIIGYDNNFMANSVNPPLSTMAVPIERVGKKAAALLYRLIHKENVDKNVIYDCTYIKRHTTYT
ncbi:MAG: substrate-binding domain-containing protein, partial [Bacillota bacterium]